MTHLNFGAFLAPHHPIGEHPMLQFQRDLDFVEHLDKLGFNEFWCGEHHSTGWEMIASPEMFLAAAGQRSHRINLGTGVVSLPYHHPFNVAQRMVQLDHMTGGRAIFGSGPGALPSDAYTLGIDPMTQRDRQDEAIGVIRRLMSGEDRFDYECEWFTMRDAKLQLLPLQEDLPFAVASMISPSGMTLAGKHRTGVLSIGSMSTAGLQALPTQWSFAEDSAAKHGNTVSRKDWRIVMSWHLAETRAKAKEQAKDGLHRWHNEYTVGTLMRPGATAFETPDSAVEEMAYAEQAAAVIGTPDDLIESITKMIDLTGGFGTVIGFVHDWANPKDTFNSWDLVARYVVPEINGYLKSYRESQKYVIEHREVFDRAGEAVVSKIMENEKAAAAMAEEVTAQSAMQSHNAPDLQKAANKESAK
ncbi:MAG: LLM class flavin-dependent oxidoreductase [bacterium]|nr:LLM class flavin-dependent oxidoreductase [Gammaproteobacteria bacterium]HIL95008.1 LLM class flavin-dependent oxidoreductase [Pseudomonadales bacterium]